MNEARIIIMSAILLAGFLYVLIIFILEVLK